MYTELSQIKSEKNPLVSATWRSMVALERLLAVEASKGSGEDRMGRRQSPESRQQKSLLWEGVARWMEGK